MVFTCGILDGLAYAFTGLGRMTLEPEISCQGYTNNDVMIEAEVNLACSLRARPVPERSLKLRTRFTMLAYKLKCPTQNRICQGHCGRILHNSINGPAKPCVMQRSLEVSIADIEHRQHAQQPHLAEDITARFGNRQASVQRRTRFIALPAHLHQRNAEARLEMHFLGSATRVIIQSEYCLFRPAIAFRK